MTVSVYKDSFSARRGADIAVKNFAAEMSIHGYEVRLFDKTTFAAGVRLPCDVFVATGTNELFDLRRAFPRGFPWPVVVQLHVHPEAMFKSAWLKPRKWRYNFAVRRAFSYVSAVQVLMSNHAGALRRVLGRSCPEKIVVIGNAVPDVRFDPAVTAKSVILYPAAIHLSLKRQQLLVDAFSRIAKDFPSWQVHLYGQGSEHDEARLASLIRSRKLEGRVVMKGYADLSTIYPSCAFVAFTSAREGFPLAVLEAAAFGKPTVTCTPNMDDVIRDGETGVFCADTPEDLSAAMRRLMSNPDLTARLGAAAKERTEQLYSREKIMGEWELLLEEVATTWKRKKELPC